MTNPETPGIFSQIRKYGQDVYQTAKKYCDQHEKLAATREQLTFNNRCKRAEVLPKSLKYVSPIKTQEAFRIARNTGR